MEREGKYSYKLRYPFDVANRVGGRDGMDETLKERERSVYGSVLALY